MVRCPPPLYNWSRGISDIWAGMASSETVAMNSHSRPLKSIQAKAYAAKAAKAIGITVAGRAMARELSKARHSPPWAPADRMSM